MPSAGFRVSKYDEDLQLLNQNMLELLKASRAALGKACEALNERDTKKAEVVVFDDDLIDDLEIEVHKWAVDLIMRYQPISVDLRVILASVRVASDLERIGDIAEN